MLVFGSPPQLFPVPKMPRSSNSDQRFRLTASTIARYFKHGCDRLFRWDTVETGNRGRSGIGWNVPARIRSHSRPGIKLLMKAGDEFEIENLDALQQTFGIDLVHIEGKSTRGGRELVDSVSLSRFEELLLSPQRPKYIAQLEIDLAPEDQGAFLQRFDLDPQRVKLGVARPDLIEISEEPNGLQLRIWDFKASQTARHEHFVQVAFYSFLLEYVVSKWSHLNVRVDVEWGVIQSREGEETFELAPYRLAVQDFLRKKAPALLNTLAADAHYHVCAGCVLCEYMSECQAQADAGGDLSRIAYISSESKRKLRQAGLRTHRELSVLDIAGADWALSEALSASSHDLAVHLPRYVATAQALEDGAPRVLQASTLQMPYWEDIRVVISAEQDAVTGTCFALGIKTYEGWDSDANRPMSREHVFVADDANAEGTILHAFLQTLNTLLVSVDTANREVNATPVDGDSRVIAGDLMALQLESQLAEFKSRYPRLYRSRPDDLPLLEQREALAQAVKEAKIGAKETRKLVERERNRAMRSLHFYVYDSLDLIALKRTLERHVFDVETEGLLDEIKTLIRLFPPSSLLPDPETFRSMPGTVLTDALKTLVALPVPYLYDLSAVSELYQPSSSSGGDAGWVYRPRYGFGFEYSNQVAFERIHDLWNNQPFTPDPGNRARDMLPEAVRQEIERTVVNKLRATDSVVRRLKQDHKRRLDTTGQATLLLRKEPFRLYDAFDPVNFGLLEALRVFSILETSLAELGVKHIHTLPVLDRAAKFECIYGLRYLPDHDGNDGSMWFEFPAACRDVKFNVGEFNLVLTPEDDPSVLLGDVDGKLFDGPNWKVRDYKVKLEEYDLDASPPRVRLLPDSPSRLRSNLDLTLSCSLDRLYADYTTRRVLDALSCLQNDPTVATHVHQLVGTGTVAGWSPIISDVTAVEELMRTTISNARNDSGDQLDPDRVLNDVQWHTWREVFQEPLTLIWGPPGTGKTHTVAQILLGYALASRLAGRPLRILVTAFTHHAIVNVLTKVAEWADLYAIPTEALEILKVKENPADAELPQRVARVQETDLAASVTGDGATCVIVGATVWSTQKAMQSAGSSVQEWFDVILIDESSQMRLPDALIALTASKASANIILAGDDRQLPPIIHGTYPEEHEHMLSSAFSFMRWRTEDRAASEPDVLDRVIFQLEENFRMNEPLTAYPREVLYGGRFYSAKPAIRIVTSPEISVAELDLVDFVLHPGRAAVLVWYEPPRSYTARNPVEARLAQELIKRLSDILVDETTQEIYSPERFASQGAAVLAPHRAQNSSIRAALSSVGFGVSERPMPLVDTVEKLQGKERDVVVVSYGVADDEYAHAEADFLLSRNRFNVAVTRARKKVVVLCSSTTLDAVPMDRKVLLESMMLKEFRNYCFDGHVELPWICDGIGELRLHIQWRGFDHD
jgi:hypothetical protein